MASGGDKIRVDSGAKNALQTLLQHAMDVAKSDSVDSLIAHLPKILSIHRGKVQRKLCDRLAPAPRGLLLGQQPCLADGIPTREVRAARDSRPNHLKAGCAAGCDAAAAN